MPRANDGDRTRDTNLEGWDVTATPHSQWWERKHKVSNRQGGIRTPDLRIRSALF